MDVQDVLKKIKREFVKILGNNLLGIYVHGSIAFGCFRWEHSDVDFIAVVKSFLTLEDKRAILKFLWDIKDEVPPKGIEMSVVLEKHCKSFVYPTPYELHWSKEWMGQYSANPELLCETARKADFDLAAHFTIIHQVGMVLYGRAIQDVFGVVNPEYYCDSICRDVSDCMEEVEDSPVYIILNLCRVLAYIKEGLILSKEQGGNWGIQNLSPSYKEVICAARNTYNGLLRPVNGDDAKRFCMDALGEIEKIKEKFTE